MKRPVEPVGKEFSLRSRRGRAKKIVRLLGERYPDPKCELYYETPYQLLISVVLSAQATDKSVNYAMKELYQSGFGPKDVLQWGVDGVLQRIKSIGLAPTKSKNIFRLTEILLREYDGEVPRHRRELEALPGVGRKTANVILGELFGEPTLAVDTHVFRVCRRLGLHHEASPLKAEQALLDVFATTDLPHGHHLCVLHGRYTCKAIKPLCFDCNVKALCPSEPKNINVSR